MKIRETLARGDVKGGDLSRAAKRLPDAVVNHQTEQAPPKSN